MEKIPTQNTLEAETKRIPLRVVTRSQAKKTVQIETDEGTQKPTDEKVQEDTPSSSKRKRKRPRSRRGKKSTKQKSSEENNSIPKEQNMNHEPPADLVISETSSGGSS